MSIDYLEPLKLGQYAARFDDLGYEDWEDLADVQLDELQADFGMTPGHAGTLRKWLDKRSTAASEPDRPSLAPSLPAATPAARPAAVVKAAAAAEEEEVEMTSASCAAAAGPVCGGPAAAVAGAGGAD